MYKSSTSHEADDVCHSPSLHIGPYRLPNRVMLAPMAGVTDRPFRQLCRRLGAGFVTSEMVTSHPALQQTRETQLRRNHDGEPTPRSVQIVGGDAQMMAEAARYNVDCGADLIDINMGCPAKTVCKKAAGSALLKDEALVAEILDAVVSAVSVPVTLKIRTGWCRDTVNGIRIAQLAESAGIQALAVHGRTRADKYQGEAEYDTIAAIKSVVRIPVIANGDITTPEKAVDVMAYTGADGVMLGRAAQGRPWVFREFSHFFKTGKHMPSPTTAELTEVIVNHLHQLYAFYGESQGLRIARRHVGWYLRTRADGDACRRHFNTLETAQAQCDAVLGW